MAVEEPPRADDPADLRPWAERSPVPDTTTDGWRNDTKPLDLGPRVDAGQPSPMAVPVQPPRPNGSVPAGSAAPAPRGRRRRKTGKPRKAPWWELPLLVVIAVAVAVLIKTFLVQPFYIPSESMEQTLHGCAGCSGDRILVNKPIYYLRDPHPGDIVVFRAPSDQWFNEPLPGTPGNPVGKAARWFGQLIGLVPPDEHDLVKRVIATGGQTLKCCDPSGNVQVSDSGPDGAFRSLDEPYISERLTAADATFGPVTVPQGRLWVMGDNRAHSEDSRWHYQNDYRGDAVASTVPQGNVIGKAVVVAWPPSRWRTLGTPSTFSTVASAVPGWAAAAVVAPAALLRRRRR